jgi:hypothetical protein
MRTLTRENIFRVEEIGDKRFREAFFGYETDLY